MFSRIIVLLAVLIFSYNSALARDAFTLTLTVKNEFGERSASASFEAIEELVQALTTAGLKNILNLYTVDYWARAELDIRGLRAVAWFDSGGQYPLHFDVYLLEIHEVFDRHDDRDLNQRDFKAWMEREGLTRLLKGLVRESPIDPVAGNPNSLMALMVAADFAVATDPGTGEFEPLIDERRPSRFAIGARFGRYTAEDFKTNVYTLPLRCAITLRDPSRTIVIDLPFTAVDSHGSKAQNGSLGLGLRLDRTRSWSLTPAVRAGFVHSPDLGSGALVYSASATSNYNVFLGDAVFSIGNMLGFYKTGSLAVGDYDVDYDLTNYVFRNGVDLEGSLNFRVFGGRATWQLSVVDTRFFGDELFVERYNDIALSFGTCRQRGSYTLRTFRLGITGTLGENDYRGLEINIGYWF